MSDSNVQGGIFWGNEWIWVVIVVIIFFCFCSPTGGRGSYCGN